MCNGRISRTEEESRTSDPRRNEGLKLDPARAGMKTLIVGSGGREHALAWTLSKDPSINEVYAAPGNPGIAEIATCVPIGSSKIDELAAFASKHTIDLTIVGPEAPLGAGIVDTFSKQNLAIFGPDLQAARIETSKRFAKDLWTK